MARRSAAGVDAPIEGAADEQMTVRILVDEMRRVRQLDAEWYKYAEIRERIVLGEHMPDVDPTLTQTVNPGPELREPMHENVIMPALQTLVARIDQGRIDAKAWPHTPTPARIAAAEGANLVLDAERARQRRDMKVHEALLWALIHGESGIYTTWDEAYGPVEAVEPVINEEDGFPMFDPATGMPQMQIVEEYGALRIEVVSTFAFWTSGEDSAEDVRWQVRRRIVDKYTAMKALRASGIYTKCEDKSFATKNPRRRKRGVEVLEVWVKPCAMVEPGMFALIVDDNVCLPPVKDDKGNVVTNADGSPQTAQTPSVFPYRHKRLPITVLSCMRVEDSPHGHTVTKDGIAQQRLVDVSLRSILRLTDVAGDARVIGPDAVIDAIDEERTSRIKYNGPAPWKNATGWLTGPDVPQGPLAVYSLAKAGLQDVMGVSNESVTGGDPTSTTSGEQLKTAAALDAQKTVPVRRRAEVAWEEVDKQSIELFREKASKARLCSVAGTPVRAMYLEGADLDGVDVAIEQASGLAQMHSGQARSAEERMAAGQLDPVAGAEMAQTGARETLMDGETKARVEKQGIDALRNVPQMPLPGVDGQAAARLLRMFLARAPAGKTAALLQLIAMYEQTMAPMMPAPAANGGAPKVTPSGAPLEPTGSPEVIQ